MLFFLRRRGYNYIIKCIKYSIILNSAYSSLSRIIICVGERSLKSEISSLLVEKSGLEARINNLISTKAVEKQTLTSLEKKLAEEKKQRSDFQLKLETERKSKKEANAERNLAQAQQSANSACVQKLEAEIAKLRDELARTEQRANTAEEVGKVFVISRI